MKTPLLSPVTTRQAPFAEALLEIAASRNDVVVLSADVSRWTDVVPFAERFPERFLQVGMAEQNLIGIAGGIAKTGLLPIAVTYACFASRRSFEQIEMALSTGPNGAVLVGFLPGITTPFRATHQATDDLALMRAIPGMTVLDPADATELRAALHAAVDFATRERRAVYLRAMRGTVAQLFDPTGFDLTIGQARRICEGTDAGLIGTGIGTAWSLEALEVLSSRGVSGALLHVPTLKPVDEDAIVRFCRQFDKVTVVENHSTIGGLGAAVAAAVANHGVGARVACLGISDSWGEHGSIGSVRRALGLDADSICEAVLA